MAYYIADIAIVKDDIGNRITAGLGLSQQLERHRNATHPHNLIRGYQECDSWGNTGYSHRYNLGVVGFVGLGHRVAGIRLGNQGVSAPRDLRQFSDKGFRVTSSGGGAVQGGGIADRKSTRLNSSH